MFWVAAEILEREMNVVKVQLGLICLHLGPNNTTSTPSAITHCDSWRILVKMVDRSLDYWRKFLKPYMWAKSASLNQVQLLVSYKCFF